LSEGKKERKKGREVSFSDASNSKSDEQTLKAEAQTHKGCRYQLGCFGKRRTPVNPKQQERKEVSDVEKENEDDEAGEPNNVPMREIR